MALPWTDRSRSLFSVAVVTTCLFATPAFARDTPSTRLVTCDNDQSCLLVSGHRDNAGDMVRINGHPITVEGAHKWRARLPVAVVKAWSRNRARTIEVAVAGRTQDAKLPIGMLGHEELEFVRIALK